MKNFLRLCQCVLSKQVRYPTGSTSTPFFLHSENSTRTSHTEVDKSCPALVNVELQPHNRHNAILSEDFQEISPNPLPSFNLASYVNKSELLQSLIKIGVSIHQLEKRKNVHSWLMTLDFDKNVKPVIQFLVDQGVAPHLLGTFITKNPYILQQSLEDLDAKTAYLKSKKFSNEMISRIYSRNPLWLQYSVESVDSRLGFFQQTFKLTGNELRGLMFREPRLLSRSHEDIKMMNFGIKEEMGFQAPEMKALLLAKPKLWIMNKSILVDRFDYLHNTVKMDHDTILRFPAVLTCRDNRIKPRHEFLKFKNMAQYDPKTPNYVSPLDLIRDTDAQFSVMIAKSSVEEFNDFCKTL